LFLHPEVTEEYEVAWHVPNKESVVKILCDRHQFSEERVQAVLDKYMVLGEAIKQKNLLDF
jgi:flap endonuclease-1